MKRRNRRISLTIDTLAAGGDGVGRDEEGRVTFVPRAVPGDRLLVQLIDERKQFARANIVEVLEPSANRVEPACPHFAKGDCGGCQWQHVAAAAQREAKHEIVDNGLRRAIERGLRRMPLLEPCTPLGWRRRARLTYWARGPRVLGFFPPRSTKITDIKTCPQLEAGLQQGLDLVRTHLLPGLRDRGEVELLLAENGNVHVSLLGPADPQAVKALADQEGIAGVLHGKAVFGAKQVELESGISASSAGFAQASRAGNIALCQEVAKATGELRGKRVLELYAGTGNFTRLFGHADAVVAIEQGDVADAGPAAASGNTTWLQADVQEACGKLIAEAARFDVVVLDPPRTGAKDVLASILSFAPERVIYVSCDVATLARDLEILFDGGYVATHAQPIDLMPQTSQVELVVVLVPSRAPSAMG